MACLDSTDRLFHWTTPMLETLLKCLCVWSWNKEIVLRAPQIMSVNGIGVGKFLWYILGTCLFTVLNNWFVRLWARLIQLRSGRIWGDLTSQPVQVIISAALFCNFSTLWLRLVLIFPQTTLQYQDEGKLVSVSWGRQVLLRLYHFCLVIFFHVMFCIVCSQNQREI